MHTHAILFYKNVNSATWQSTLMTNEPFTLSLARFLPITHLIESLYHSLKIYSINEDSILSLSPPPLFGSATAALIKPILFKSHQIFKNVNEERKWQWKEESEKKKWKHLVSNEHYATLKFVPVNYVTFIRQFKCFLCKKKTKH